MSEPQNTPKIEDKILELYEGDLQKTALEFIAYLNENDMTPQEWFGPTIWKTPCGGKYYCFGIFMNQPGKFNLYFYRSDYKSECDKEFIKTVHTPVRPCIDCGGECPKGMDMTIFGKDFPNTCFQFPIQFTNPDKKTLEHIKEFIEYWRVTAPDNAEKLHVLG